MIITLSGTVAHKGDAFAVIETGGVGYQVHMNAKTLGTLKTGAHARVWTHEYVREDARELYGFATQFEHALFRRLLGVSGVGPKIAMHMLALGSVRDIESMIERGDIDRLTSVPGVGKKTAQKIVLELKGKLVAADGAGEGGEDVLSALVNLGYDRGNAREALNRVAATEPTVEGRLRAALKELGR